LGAHLLSVHAASPPSRLNLGSLELKDVIKSFKAMGNQKFVFAHLDGLLRVAENLSVVVEELERLEAEVQGINETLGEHLGEDEP
jgi:uncharacterized protein Yka (UPF0111/DUF47 family)